VKLVYHKNAAELRCHYCGYKHALWNACAECGSTQLLIQGFGTEMVEDELQSLYPDFRIARLDMDAVRTKTGHEKVLTDFEDGQTDILVGTQMVTKGLDFDNVNLVGILSADQILNFSDFRASERGYQLMMQVSGRAGRKHRQGTVLIQAMNVAHPVLDWVVKHETHPFYKEELDQRMKFGYPPYVRLVRIILKHKEQAKVLNAAYALVKGLGTGTTFQILGPVQPGISRVRNKYLVEILIKMSNNGKVMRTVKEKVLSARAALLAINQFKQVDVILDVDPT
jgi:primosomal protein N' (replication factor Y)